VATILADVFGAVRTLISKYGLNVPYSWTHPAEGLVVDPLEPLLPLELEPFPASMSWVGL